MNGFWKVELSTMCSDGPVQAMPALAAVFPAIVFLRVLCVLRALR